MATERSVIKLKWLTILTFLALDVLQIALVSIINFDESLAWIITFDTTLSNPIVSISIFSIIMVIQLILAYNLTMRMMRSESMEILFPQFDIKKEWSCRYTRDEIVRWTLELTEESGVEVSKIYLMKSPLPNACTFSLPFIGSTVVVHSNILDLLGQTEVRARSRR